MKCLSLIIQSIDTARVLNVTICVDAQVVLSWILTGNVKSKNVFASNRVKDITLLREEILSNHGIKCNFKYVPSENNPADLLTRGISFREFQQKQSYWLKGPSFIMQDHINWPSNALGCLSEHSKLLTCSSSIPNGDSIIPINKYSNVNKLFRITSLVLRFIHKVKKSVKCKEDIDLEAKLYLIKREQRVNFPVEINFLTNSNASEVPLLVKSLNLFLDDNQIIRCKGRLEKSSFNYDVRNPILLPRHSPLTELLVWDAHQRCKHMGTQLLL